MNVTLNACNVVKDDSRRDGRGGDSKIIQNKNKFLFHTSAKKTSCFAFFLFFFIKQACRTKGGGESFLEGGTEAR